MTRTKSENTQDDTSPIVSTGKRIEPVEGYRVNEQRVPSKPLVKLQPTASQTIGPFYPATLVKPGENDLTSHEPSRGAPTGRIMCVTGKILDERGLPVRSSLVEVWQANEFGRYRHRGDQSELPLDPNFDGVGRTITDDDGGFFFRTIKPGSYAVPGYDDWMRPPHIHFSLFGAGLMDRLITQMYFPGEPRNEPDLILNSIHDEAARQRLFGNPLDRPNSIDGIVTYEFDIVLRGHDETPFFED